MVRKADRSDASLAPLFGSREMSGPLPRYRLADGEIESRAAYQLIHDDLTLDGNPLLNLASFVTTWMEPEAERLFAETAGKNFIDAEEYPITADIERRCVSILADLYHAGSTGEEAMGTSTVGSSEAVHLCGLAMKWRWRKRREAAGQPTGSPNIVIGSHYQVVWEKFARYFDVELRTVPLEGGRYTLDPDRAVAAVDDDTIGVVAILGSTYTGHFDDVAALDAALRANNEANGRQVPIHVDAASGGFVAPFAYPDLAWDFRVPSVRSINVSGHKYGLVYPGVGWAIWRDRADLPDELVFHDNYLGSDQITFALNFSKGAAQVIGQYYNFIRLGREGYTRIMRNLFDVRDHLSEILQASRHLDEISAPGALPVVCLRLHEDAPFSAHDISDHLRRRGWIVPAYTMPADLEDLSVLRVVIREGFSTNLADLLMQHAHEVAEELHGNPPPLPAARVGQQGRVC